MGFMDKMKDLVGIVDDYDDDIDFMPAMMRHHSVR